MKKFLVISILLSITLTGFYFFKKNNNVGEKKMPTSERVKNLIENLTLEEKIGQMLIVSYSSSYVDEDLKNAIINNKPGGFILFSENITNFENTKKFIDEIKSFSDIPMFISIDQEGGKVQRLQNLEDLNVSKIPDMLSLGKTNNETLAYEIGTLMAKELNVFGINMNFAPVIDIIENENSFIGNRSFGSDVDTVVKMSNSLAKGLEENNVIAVYKHFPGHGSTIEDSHYKLPVINKTKIELKEKELVPFENAINNGAKVIMIGHIAIPEIDGNTPASLSKKIIKELLKNEMNYNGLVITDALNMKAITDNYSEKEIYEMAINAGVDLLLMPSSSSSAIKLIKESISEGIINEEHINKSVKKILTLKFDFFKNKYQNKNILGSEKHLEIINKIN